MAHLRQHKRSPYWTLRRRNLDTGKWEEKSTGMRVDNQSETRKAQRAAEKASIEEQRVGSPGTSPAFLAWVPPYMASHWPKESGSAIRYRAAWQAIKMFLAKHDIIYPRQIRYSHGDAYMRWRKVTEVHGQSVSHNTALLEVKFLAQLMNEAIRLEFAETNPLAKLGIQKEASKESRELTADEIKKMRGALKTQPQWMQTTFAICLYTGCRFSEASVPFTRINFRTSTMILSDSKRKATDPKKLFPVPIDPGLHPLLVRLKAEGHEATCTLSEDKNGRLNKLMKKTLGEEVSTRCLRVTFITKAARAGVSFEDCMVLVNHSNEAVHRVYSKLGIEDVRRARARIHYPKGLGW